MIYPRHDTTVKYCYLTSDADTDTDNQHDISSSSSNVFRLVYKPLKATKSKQSKQPPPNSSNNYKANLSIQSCSPDVVFNFRTYERIKRFVVRTQRHFRQAMGVSHLRHTLALGS